MDDYARKLSEGRRDWWLRMTAVAGGVFLGQVGFAAALWLVFPRWVESL